MAPWLAQITTITVSICYCTAKRAKASTAFLLYLALLTRGDNGFTCLGSLGTTTTNISMCYYSAKRVNVNTAPLLSLSLFPNGDNYCTCLGSLDNNTTNISIGYCTAKRVKSITAILLSLAIWREVIMTVLALVPWVTLQQIFCYHWHLTNMQ